MFAFNIQILLWLFPHYTFVLIWLAVSEPDVLRRLWSTWYIYFLNMNILIYSFVYLPNIMTNCFFCLHPLEWRYILLALCFLMDCHNEKANKLNNFKHGQVTNGYWSLAGKLLLFAKLNYNHPLPCDYCGWVSLDLLFVIDLPLPIIRWSMEGVTNKITSYILSASERDSRGTVRTKRASS